MAWMNSDLDDVEAVPLTSQQRPQSASVDGQDMNLFVYDAFEYDDSNTEDSPVLTLKDEWTFDAGAIGNFDATIAESDSITFLEEYLQTLATTVQAVEADQEWSMSQITVGQGSIDIRVTSVEEDTEYLSESYITLESRTSAAELELGTTTEGLGTLEGEVETNTTNIQYNSDAFIKLGVDTSEATISIEASYISTESGDDLDESISRYNNAMIELGASDDGSTIDISADNVTISGDVTINDFIEVNADDTTVSISGDIISTADLKKTVIDEGSITFFARQDIADDWTTIATASGLLLGTSVKRLNISEPLYVNKMTVGPQSDQDDSNVVIGKNAFSDADSNGVDNVAIGSFVLNDNGTGGNNVGIGDHSLFQNSEGYGNLGIGSETLYTNSSGNSNIAFGGKACFSNTSGDDNIGIGSLALQYNQTGENNIGIGKWAGQDLTGDENICIGHSTSPSSDSASNEMILGDSTYIYDTYIAGRTRLSGGHVLSDLGSMSTNGDAFDVISDICGSANTRIAAWADNTNGASYSGFIYYSGTNAYFRREGVNYTFTSGSTSSSQWTNFYV